jgi:hypothetical protein
MDLVSKRSIDVDFSDLAGGSDVVRYPRALRPTGEIENLPILDIRIQPRRREIQVEAVDSVIEILRPGAGATEIRL